MIEGEPSLDELIAREKKAWAARAEAEATRPARVEEAVDRLHREVALPRPGALRVAAPYLAIIGIVSLLVLAMNQFTAPTPTGEPGATHEPPVRDTTDSAPAHGAGVNPAHGPTAAPHPLGPAGAQSSAPPTATPTIPAPAHTTNPESTGTRVTTRRDAGSNAVAPDGLARELALLRDAQLSLRTGDAEHAIELAAIHAREFPSGTLAPERRALERRARCILERRALDEPEDTCR
jgi:hypothetical protein